MGAEIPDAFDLWGNPIYSTRGKRGRPPFRRSAENVNRVNMLLAAGWSNERIASVILDARTGKSISLPTLHRHFRDELQARQAARDRLQARRMERVWALAESGNIGAEKLLGNLFEDEVRTSVATRVRNGEDNDSALPIERETPKGKKVQQADAAHTLFEGSALLTPQARH